MPPNDPKQSRLHRWIITPILKQLKKGSSPQKLALAIALGITLGIIPIMGSTTLICLLAAHLLKLNQPVLHLFKTLTYPLHLALIIPFIRLGQKINGVPLLSLSIPEMIGQFKASPSQFVTDFAQAALHGIEAWAISSIILIPLIYLITLPILKTLSKKIEPLT